MAGKTTPQFTITGLDKIAKPNPIPENAPKLTSPLLSESDVIKAAMSGKSQIIGGENPGFVDTATRPKSSGGGGLLGDIGNVVSNAGSAITEAVEQVAKPVEQAVKPVTAPVVKAVEQVAQTAVQAVTPVVESVVDVAKVPVKAVEQITKIDAPKVVESVAKETILAPVKAAETVVKAAEPVAQAAAQVVQQPVKAVQEIAKIDVPKVAETVVKQAAQVPIKTVETAAQIGLSVAKPVMDLTKIDYARDFNELLDNANELVGTTLLETGKALEGIPATLSALSPYGSAGSGSSGGGGGGAQLDANAPNLGDDKVYSDIETGTAKGSQMSEEERLRRIRRLLTNRYGREKTILGGAGDTTSRRRYAI